LAWGEYQATSRALDMLDNLSRLGTIPAGVLKEVVSSYRARNNEAQRQLDETAEQFPEFVHDLQEQLGRRLVLIAELDFVEHQALGGTLLSSVAGGLTAELEQEMRNLRGHEIAKLKTTPEELLRRVPFLRDLPPEEFFVISARLHGQTFAAGEVIFRQGDPGDALYIIARGVVRISRREGYEWRHLATLMAGNFFGEAALLEHRPRNATVTAVTPCSLYKLRRKDLEVIIEVYPHIRRALEQENKRREIENVNLPADAGQKIT